jgi:hypothetical protein
MPKLIVMVIEDPDLANDVILAWERAGAKSATLLHSIGMTRLREAGLLRDDLPLIPSLAALEEPHEINNATLFSVVADTVDVDVLIAETEQVTGPLDGPHTGMLFVLPLARVVGGQV